MVKKKKRKLTAAEKREKKRRRKEFETIFINGKQKRAKRAPKIDWLKVDEFILRNADPIKGERLGASSWKANGLKA